MVNCKRNVRWDNAETQFLAIAAALGPSYFPLLLQHLSFLKLAQPNPIYNKRQKSDFVWTRVTFLPRGVCFSLRTASLLAGKGRHPLKKVANFRALPESGGTGSTHARIFWPFFNQVKVPKIGTFLLKSHIIYMFFGNFFHYYHQNYHHCYHNYH